MSQSATPWWCNFSTSHRSELLVSWCHHVMSQWHLCLRLLANVFFCISLAIGMLTVQCCSSIIHLLSSNKDHILKNIYTFCCFFHQMPYSTYILIKFPLMSILHNELTYLTERVTRMRRKLQVESELVSLKNPQKSPFTSRFQVFCVLRFVPLFPHGEECGVRIWGSCGGWAAFSMIPMQAEISGGLGYISALLKRFVWLKVIMALTGIR